MKEVFVKYYSTYLDGGTIIWIDDSNNLYYEDHRIRTNTPGKVYDRYPGDKNAKILDVILNSEYAP